MGLLTARPRATTNPPPAKPPASPPPPPRHDAAPAAKPLRVGDLLLDKGMVSQEQLDQAIAYQKSSGHKKLLGEVLVELDFATHDQVLEALADGYGVPFAKLSPKLVDPKAVELLPRKFIEQHAVLPLYLVRGKLTVAVSEPSNVFLTEEVERESGHAVQVVAATAADILTTLKSVIPDGNVFMIDDLIGSESVDLKAVERQIEDVSNLEALADESPVIKLVNHLIFAAVRDGASDIHVEPGDTELRVRFRVDGSLFEKLSPPLRMLPAIVSRIKIMSGLDISERRVPQDGGITVGVDKRQVDLRVSTMPGKFGEKVVMRIIDKQNAMVGLEQLGFGYEMLTTFRGLLHQPNGVILVTGPTGSGKSTTLYAALGEINDETVNVSTVEDPVEYNLPGVNQFQTHDRAGFTFASSLRALLRQDPDVIMVGEVRDQETARIANQAALTGHLVLSTLHTNDAPSAMTRLFNIGVEPYLVAASVRGVLAQRLVRRICPDCREAIEETPKLRRTLDELSEILPEGERIETVYQGRGCKNCRNSGYKGRLGIYELYVPDDESLDAISRGASLQEIRKLAHAGGGYTTLRQDGLVKLKNGLTSVEELFKASSG